MEKAEAVSSVVTTTLSRTILGEVTTACVAEIWDRVADNEVESAV